MILLTTLTILICFVNIACTTSDRSEINRSINAFELLVTSKNEIWRINLNGEKHRYLTNTTAIGDVDYHLEKNILFWIDAENREIHSQSLDLNATGFHIIFKQEMDWEPVALAVDFVGDKLYVADVLGSKIDVFELNVQHRSIVLGTDLVRPLDIKLDPPNGLIFILDGFRIVRANMDGTSPTLIVKKDIRTSHGISVDLIHQKIYWFRGSDLKIISSNYSGEDIHILESKSSTYQLWTKFVAYNKTIYWANRFITYKSDCPEDKVGVRTKTIYQSNPIPTVKILHSSLQKSYVKPCENNNGQCQNMCIVKPNYGGLINLTHHCACNVGLKINANLKNCTIVKDFLLYSQSRILKTYLLETCTAGFCEPFLPITHEKTRLKDFDYIYQNNFLYYIAKPLIGPDTIYKVHPNESIPEIFSLGKQNSYQSLSIDWITSNLYFADSFEGTINVLSINNSSQKLVLIENLKQVENIVVHPNKGLIFFLQTNEDSKVSMINSAHTDGSNLLSFNNIFLQKPCGFTIDFEEDRIYWYQWNAKEIQHSTLDLSEVKNIRSSLTQHVRTISINGKWMYVINSNNEGLWRFNKNTGEEQERILADYGNRITRIKIFSSKNQIVDVNHPCIINNGACSKFCFGFKQQTIANSSWIKVCS